MPHRTEAHLVRHVTDAAGTIGDGAARSELTISAMAEADVPDVARLDQACFSSRWTVQTYRNELVNAAAAYRVARLGQVAVGFAGMWVAADEAHITLLGVQEDHRGRGIGTRLLIDLLMEARRRGAAHATLEVRERNHVAQRMYKRFRFEVRGKRKGYYTDTGEAALIMWANGIDRDEYHRLLQGALDGLPPVVAPPPASTASVRTRSA